jgi:hypothetical protein
MLSRVQLWKVLVGQLLAGMSGVVLLALLLHFPNLARRPQPSPDGLSLVLFIAMSVVVLGLGTIPTQSSHTLGVILTMAVWLVATCGFAFVWVNTFGT